MSDRISSVLETMADMNAFGGQNDRLSAIADSVDDSELFEDDLDQVFAAYSPMKYEDFMKRISAQGKGPQNDR